MRANLVEIFSSAQGEGPHVGALTLFVRFAGCDLRCRWCDSAHTWTPAPRARLEQEPGSGRFVELPNPVELGTAMKALEALGIETHRFVSLTGGEPLLQAEGVAALAERLRGRGPRLLLETHGLARRGLERVIPWIDVVSMDWKLASDVRRATDPEGGGGDFHDEHEAFLEVARRAPEVVVKLVVSPATQDAEVLEVARRVARVAPEAPLVLQPVTPVGPVHERPAAARMLELARRAGVWVRDVRVIPQTHPLYGAP